MMAKLKYFLPIIIDGEKRMSLGMFYSYKDAEEAVKDQQATIYDYNTGPIEHPDIMTIYARPHQNEKPIIPIIY